MLQWPRSPRSHPRNPRFSNRCPAGRFGPTMFPRYRDTRGMDHVRLYAARRSQRASQKPSRPASKASAMRVIVRPALTASSRQRMQHGKQPFWVRLQLLAGLTLNAGNDTADRPARLAHLDDGNDRAILVQGDEGPAQVVRLGHRGTPSIKMQRRSCHLLAARPIEIFRPPVKKSQFFETV